MINKNRVRQMSRMAMMESDIGKDVIRICSFRRVDYVIIQILKGIVTGTVCYGAVFLLWFCFQWDTLNAYFADAQFEAFFIKILIRYGIFMAVYLVICGIVAAKRYRACARKRHVYLKYLRRLHRSYAVEQEEDE